MKISEIRRSNFALLRENKTLNEISELTGIDSTYLTRIERGYRNFTEKKARQIEKGLSLPELWLDIGSDNEENSIINEICEELEYVPEELLPAVLASVRALKKKE